MKKPILIKLTNTLLGSITVVPDADGQGDFDQTMKRSDKTDGVVFEYVLDLQFTKDARQFLIDAFNRSGGIEAIVTAELYEYESNEWRYYLMGKGVTKFTNRSQTKLRFKTSIDASNFQRSILNSFDTDVDLDTVVSQGGVDLPATPTITLPMHSKLIIKEALAGPNDGLEFQKEDVFEFVINNGGGSQYSERIIYGQVDTQRKAVEEYDTFALPYGWQEFVKPGGFPILSDYTPGMNDVPGTTPAYLAFLAENKTTRSEFKRVDKLADAGTGTIQLRWNLKHEFIADNSGGDVDICGSGSLGNIEVTYWFEQRGGDDTIKVNELIGAYSIPGCGGDTRDGGFQSVEWDRPATTLELGDKLYVYFLVRVYGGYGRPSVLDGHVNHTFRITAIVAPEEEDDLTLLDYTFLQIKAETAFPATDCKAYLTYEALNKMFQYYSGQVDCFRSNYFGRTDTILPYPVDGPGSLRALTPGAFIRKLLDRKAFVNGSEFYDALNAMDCLGLGFETLESGAEVARIEPLSFFYNKNSLILDLGVVGDVEITTLTKQYNKTIEIGYPKLDIEKTNALDEPNTLRRYNFPLTQISTKLTITSKYKTAGAEIEDQRRKSATTEDSKNDEANFFIDLVREGGGFRPTRDDGFILVEGLYSPETAYNLNFSPRRRLPNHGKVVAQALYSQPIKVITFSYGEGNYNMVTQKVGEAAPLAENADFDVTAIEPDIEPDGYKFEKQLSGSQMRAIRANPYGYFRFREYPNGPVLEGYLSSIKRSTRKNLGTFELIKVFRIVPNA